MRGVDRWVRHADGWDTRDCLSDNLWEFARMRNGKRDDGYVLCNVVVKRVNRGDGDGGLWTRNKTDAFFVSDGGEYGFFVDDGTLEDGAKTRNNFWR